MPARAARPGQIGRTTVAQGAALAASDTRRTAYGIGKRVARELGAYNALKGEYESPLAPLPNVPNRTGNPRTGQFASAKAVLADLGKIKEIFESPLSSAEDVAAAQARYERTAAKARGLGFTEQELADYYYDPKSLDYYLGNEYTGSANVFETGLSALLTDVPTSTTNYRRPRTVAAGYDPENRIVTVIFRDGTAWNYYGVPDDAWIKFHQSITKGPFLDGGGDGRPVGDLLTYDGHGPADISQLSPRAQREFYRISRAAQVLSKDKTTGRAVQNRRPKSQPNLLRAQNREYQAKMQAKQGRNPNANKGRARSK